ncbi:MULTISPECIES: hypothetical protein [unclassified Paenibacillus]|uniref:hypothetical protein n=1 Tax=unclassified Paenibacillus TaxID=185978 RepID=UPI000955B8FA|nr:MULTISPECIES: hypothetical protein [unclassified Paenibacillus]ASS68853.1 hypothetical protein CIC07_24055 [Paenibacillus sp. RUD330]SIR17957.1 hypothetical protein SAMN05880555_3218 [Paenibacillus sp. RU4X]SIR20995.1 hypothetical protein SAMN05880570_2779 [Paenibacillus sp. RU4T]
MKKLDLILAADGEYARRLCEYMRDMPGGGRWRVTTCTTPDSLRGYLKGGYPVDLVLVEPAFVSEAEKACPASRLAVLVRRRGEGGGYPELLQFRPLPELMASMEAMHAGRDALGASADGRAFVAAVYDPAGGQGKTLLSAELARQAAAQGKRVLYLNFEVWEASEVFLGASPPEMEGGIGRLLYCLKAGKQDAARQLAQIRTFSSGMKCDYFPPSPGPEERLAMTGEDAALLLDFLAGGGFYDFIVADMDSRLDDASASIWQRSGRIAWLVRSSESSLAKTRAALDYAARAYPEGLGMEERKVWFVQSMARQELPGEAELTSGSGHAARDPQLEYAAALPVMAHYREGGNVSPAYAGSVRQLLRRMLPELAG